MGDGAPHGPGWLLDERASAGRENLDAIHVSRYDVKEDGDALAEVGLLQGLGLGASSTVLDLGAGTGQFALAVAPVCSRVVAADVSPVMRERLRLKVEASGHGNIECVSAGFLTYEHTGEPIDFATMNSVKPAGTWFLSFSSSATSPLICTGAVVLTAGPLGSAAALLAAGVSAAPARAWGLIGAGGLGAAGRASPAT